MSADSFAEWDAAYVLGALSSGERLEFEAHLEYCDECAGRVAELAGMPGVLARLDRPSADALRDLPEEPADRHDGPSTVAHLARRVHRRRRLVALTGAAAVVAAGLGGAALGEAALGPSTAAPVVAATRLAPVHGSAVSAELTATAVPWGTKLAWSCSYPATAGGAYARPGYRLVVTTTAGRTAVVATWAAHGDGASGLAAATSIPRSAIRTVDIRTDAGAVLASAALHP
jgi:anti-sigma factor RsiW